MDAISVVQDSEARKGTVNWKDGLQLRKGVGGVWGFEKLGFTEKLGDGGRASPERERVKGSRVTSHEQVDLETPENTKMGVKWGRV